MEYFYPMASNSRIDKQNLSLQIPRKNFNLDFQMSGGMALYCEQMIKEYKSRSNIFFYPSDKKYTQKKHPFGTIGLRHNLNGYELDYSNVPENTHEIITVHDLQEIDYPENFSDREILRRKKVYNWIIAKQPHVICISEFTRRKIIEHIGVPEEKTYVIPHGFDHLVSAFASNIKFDWYTQQRYIYVPGKAWKHKSHMKLLRELKNSLDYFRDQQIKLYFTTNPIELGVELDVWVEENKAEDILVIIPNQSFGYHYKLMRNATLVLLPSLYEGFGLSYGESIFLKKNVVAFDLPPYGEISNKGHLVEIGNFSELINQCIGVIESTKFNSIDPGIKEFTWSRNVNNVLQIMESSSWS